MSLGIFSFDLAALINSLSDYFDRHDTPLDDLPAAEAARAITEQLLEKVDYGSTPADEAAMAEALRTAVTTVLMPADLLTPENGSRVISSRTTGIPQANSRSSDGPNCVLSGTARGTSSKSRAANR